jgi:tRNA (guanine-N7-)-methyltransferase
VEKFTLRQMMSGLYQDSLKYFLESDFEVIKSTDDLYSDNIFECNIVTEHERMFVEEGKKIKGIIAIRRG